MSGGYRLHHYVAYGGGFSWPRHHRDTRRIGGPLVEKGVAAAASDDVKHAELTSRQCAQTVEHVTVAQGKTLEYAAHKASPGVGHRLSVTAAEHLYRLNHVRRIGEGSVVGIDDAAERLGCECLAGKHIVGHCTPDSAATLQNPHAADVLKQPDGAADSTLVGEVKLTCGVCHDRSCGLYSHERPCAAAEIGKVSARCRHRSDGRSRVVTSHGDHRNGSEPCLPLHLRRQRSHLLSWKDKTSETLLRQSHRLKQLSVETPCGCVEEL